MIDTTILIPTYRHATSLPYAVRSALAQEEASIEVFVVGDGVEDDTRAGLEQFEPDPRVRFFDLPKGERHGERNRHEALAEASGRIVSYVCDDDLLLPSHVTTMLGLLEDADFAHSAPFMVWPDDVLTYIPVDLAQEAQRARLRTGDWNAIGLTGAAHTLAAYRRLPSGWHAAPEDVPTDLHMWRQFLDLPGFRGVTSTELTHLHFPSPVWQGRTPPLDAWSAAIGEPEGRERLAQRARRLATETAANLDALLAARERDLAELRGTLASIEATRTWRLRERLLGFRPVRAVAERLRAGR